MYGENGDLTKNNTFKKKINLISFFKKNIQTSMSSLKL